MNAKELNTLTDECLVKLLQNGDKNAMGELYSRYFSLAHRKCISFTKNVDDANDLTQDVMIRVMEKIHLFKGESKFSTWLYSVTSNYCTDAIRKTKRTSFESIDATYDLADLSPFEHEEREENEIRVDVAGRALAGISKEDQQLLFMKYQFNKSIQELQVTYSISASAVKMRLLRARSKAVDMYSLISMQSAA
ncbi:MAG: RNA polymerase sigma factor (sigma-70 family) [Cyclobacteriaceae bacterium]|jgi:RNA polymerase sigma-70 factor (ECF subfamily)